MLEIIVCSWLTKAVILGIAGYAMYKFYCFVEFDVEIKKR